jgi:hypothetical protein
MEKIVHYVYFFVCEKFHEQIPIKTSIFLVLLLCYSLCDKLQQVKNVLQSTIAFCKCTSISQHNESLRCYPTSIT